MARKKPERWRPRHSRVIPETAETAETDLRDSGKDQAGSGHGVLMQARARRAERTISRASISPCHRGQPRAADRGRGLAVDERRVIADRAAVSDLGSVRADRMEMQV